MGIQELINRAVKLGWFAEEKIGGFELVDDVTWNELIQITTWAKEHWNPRFFARIVPSSDTPRTWKTVLFTAKSLRLEPIEYDEIPGNYGT
jgi:hypothetical protein